MKQDDERWMRLALSEAEKGRPRGGPRAGAMCICGTQNAAGHSDDTGSACERALEGETAGGTLFTTTEPTGDELERCLRASLTRVVIGTGYPGASGGAAALRAAGVDVEEGICAEACAGLVADYAKYVEQSLPFVVLKAAITLDGKMAARGGDSKWISGEASRIEAHRLRAGCDAVGVGVETVILDDPRLNVRHVEGDDPRVVVFDTRLRTPPGAALMAGGPLILHGKNAAEEHRHALESAGAELVAIDLSASGHISLPSALKQLAGQGIVRLLIEGGGVLHGAFLDAGLADAVSLFIAPRILGDREGRSFAAGQGATTIADGYELRDVTHKVLDPDIWVQGLLWRETICSQD